MKFPLSTASGSLPCPLGCRGINSSSEILVDAADLSLVPSPRLEIVIPSLAGKANPNCVLPSALASGHPSGAPLYTYSPSFPHSNFLSCSPPATKAIAAAPGKGREWTRALPTATPKANARRSMIHVKAINAESATTFESFSRSEGTGTQASRQWALNLPRQDPQRECNSA